jgi:predicted phosphodiesterase
MRVAALYDIHANLPALEAVAGAVRSAGADLVVLGGDVLPGPMPVETLDYLRSLDLPTRCIHGNGEREILAIRAGREPSSVPEQYRPAVLWVADAVTEAHADWVAAWPSTLRLNIPAIGDVVFCHATPRNDTEIFTRDTDVARLRPIFEAAHAPLVVCGHTHMAFDRAVGRTRVVNAGSVGMPFGAPGAYWLLLGPDVRLMRTEYDLAAAAERVRATRYPQATAFADGNILHPPAEFEMLTLFSRFELTS